MTIASSVATLPSVGTKADGSPTIWGLNPVQLHDRFWAARGVEVVRQGERSEIVEGAELFLLTDRRTLAIFRLRDLVGVLSWLNPDLLFVRLSANRSRGYQETVVADEQDRFVCFQRTYEGAEAHLTRVAFTREYDLARMWQAAPSSGEAWRQLRRRVPRERRETARVRGRIYDRSDDQGVAQFVRDLIGFWKTPSATIPRAKWVGPGVWADEGVKLDAGVRFIGPAWVGAGRSLAPHDAVVGPAALWDDPAQRPVIEGLRWHEIEPTEAFNQSARPARLSSIRRAGKRMFDIVFALLVLICTLPIYPIAMLAIFIEDGRPFFFGHCRETIGGREFSCLKFRSMRKDAEEIKKKLMKENIADGPQFFFANDPRLTRVGRVLRAMNIDELPQFINVLKGDMSVVGPRPSPRAENQYCPPWREARLSVRPGITGLWQVKRTRRKGLDFQEWIRYDIEYVENMSFWMDLSIIWQTVVVLTRGGHRQ